MGGLPFLLHTSANDIQNISIVYHLPRFTRTYNRPAGIKKVRNQMQTFEYCMVDLKETLTHPSSMVRRLLDMADAWQGQPIPAPCTTPAYQPKQPEPLVQRLGEDGVRDLLQRYRDGAAIQALAVELGYGTSTIKRVLRAHGVRKLPSRSDQR